MAKKRSVRRPFERVKMNVCNKSARSVAKPSLIVLHDTESHDIPGNGDLTAIGHWFDTPAAKASAHVCVDAEGRSAAYVIDAMKAWHCAGFNSQSLGIEQVGFATFTETLWNRNKRAQMKKVAKYLAYWSLTHGIPLRRGKVTATGAVILSGVVTHSDLGPVGGDHHDPGPNYPFDTVLRMAKWYKRFGWY